MLYMPPEQLQHKPVGLEGDIWALGCILHETITGKPTFEAETKAEIVQRILHHVPDRLTRYYSRNFRSLVWRMLKKNPKGRPSAKELLSLDFLKELAENLSME